MADLDSLIGCKISLISHQDIRYDGTLFSINQSESSLVLKDVQAFGTEDRITDPSKKVPATSNVLSFVTFPGFEIKDLYVHEDAVTAAAAAPAPAPAPAAVPPAPVHQAKPKHEHANQKHESKPQQQHHKKAAPETTIVPPRAPALETIVNEKPTATPVAVKEQNHHKASSTVGTGSHLLKMKEKKSGDANANVVNTKQDFNFEVGLNKFHKDELETEGVPVVNKYVKDDFFDNFSADVAEDGKKQQRMTASQERVLNQETFGAVALSGGYRRGGRGGGRGSGRGGNGRGGQHTGNGNGNGNSGRGGGRGGRGRGRQSSN